MRLYPNSNAAAFTLYSHLWIPYDLCCWPALGLLTKAKIFLGSSPRFSSIVKRTERNAVNMWKEGNNNQESRGGRISRGIVMERWECWCQELRVELFKIFIVLPVPFLRPTSALLMQPTETQSSAGPTCQAWAGVQWLISMYVPFLGVPMSVPKYL